MSAEASQRFVSVSPAVTATYTLTATHAMFATKKEKG